MATSVQNPGKELLGWDIVEGHTHERGVIWYVLACGIGIAMLIYAIVVRNFLFGFILVMVGIIMATHSMRPAAQYRCVCSENGMTIGTRFYPWKDIEKFWLLIRSDVKMLYLEFGGLRPRLPVPLQESDPEQLRQILTQYIEEDTTNSEEPMSDWIVRVLKI